MQKVFEILVDKKLSDTSNLIENASKKMRDGRTDKQTNLCIELRYTQLKMLSEFSQRPSPAACTVPP